MSPAPNPSAHPCPDDEALRQVLSPDAGPGTLETVAAHLEGCDACRERLDALAQVTELRIPPEATAPSLESPVLRNLIKRLEDDPAFAMDRTSANPGASAPQDVLLPPTEPGSLGNFAGHIVLQRVASGGMGQVFKALDPGLNRVVAIKVLAPQLASSASARARFLREARAAAAVLHEFVVAIHAVGEDRGFPYLVMPFIDGPSLESRLARAPLELAQILRIGLQTALGLAAAHAQGLVHRDIKPGNILLENGVERVKLTDFGLARAVDEPGLTRDGIVAGTPEFMSPEQARGERLGPASDLFSLGAVLYRMATGRSPFRANSIPATLKRVCDEEPPPAHQLNSAIPAWLGGFIAQLMAKRPADRPASAADTARRLQHWLERVQSGQPVDFHPPGFLAPGQRRISSALLIAILLVLGLLGLGVHRWLRPHVPIPPPTTTSAFQLLTPGTSPRAFDSLDAALQAAASGDIIELAFDGPRPVPPASLRGKSLTLRARSPFHPQLVQSTSGVPLISTESSLTLQAIEFRSQAANSDDRQLAAQLLVPSSATRTLTTDAILAQGDRQSPVPALIESFGAEFAASNCRFVTTLRQDHPEDGLALLQVRRAEIRDCEFYVLGGRAIRSRFNPRQRNGDANNPSLVISNSLVFCPQPIAATTPGGATGRVALQASTLASLRLFATRPGTRLQLHLQDNLLVVRHWFQFAGESFIPKGIVWNETHNAFADPFATNEAGTPLPAALAPNSKWTQNRFPLQIQSQPGTNRLTPLDFTWTDDSPASGSNSSPETRPAFGCQVRTVGPQ